MGARAVVLGGDLLVDGAAAAAARPIRCPGLPRRDLPDGAARPLGADMVKAVHYLNQFFAGLGGEEAAGTPPTRLDGAVGPGRGLQAALDGVEIVATIACGDDYFAEHEDECSRDADRARAGGRGRAAGRRACVRLRTLRLRRRVCGRGRGGPPRDPGGRGDARGESRASAPRGQGADRPHCGERRRDARRAPRLAALASALASGRELGPPEDEGYLPRGFRRNYVAEKPGAERAIDLLLAKLAGDVRSEVAAGFERVLPPAAGRRSLAGARRPWSARPGACRAAIRIGFRRCARTTGCATRSRVRRRSIRRSTSASTAGSTSRLQTRIPTGSSRSTRSPSTCATGRIGSLHQTLYVTTGNGTPVATATRFGREIAARAGGERCPGGHPLGHLRDEHALRGNAGEGDRAGRHPDRVRDVPPDDRGDGRRESDRARTRDHAPVRPRHRGATPDRRARARDARDRGRADDGLGGAGVSSHPGGSRSHPGG